MPKAKTPSRPLNSVEKPKTLQRTYRFDTKLFEAFEDDCAQRFANPKRVIEAMILHWLSSDAKTRGEMAQELRRRTLNSVEKPKALQRTYRFNTKLFEEFEDDCAQRLSNPKRVVEAMILHWLSANAKTRSEMAQEHRRRIGIASDDD
jgi:hypothetical protein